MRFHVVVLTVVLFSISCGPTAVPTRSVGLTMLHVSDDGPYARSAPLIAGVSMTDVEAMIMGSDRPGTKAPPDCLTQIAASPCWSPPPDGSLVVALQNPPLPFGARARAIIWAVRAFQERPSPSRSRS